MIVSAIWTVAEVWEFARRLCGSSVDIESIYVRLELAGVFGRIANADRYEDLPVGAPIRSNGFRRAVILSRADLDSGVAAWATQWGGEMFADLGVAGISSAYVRRKVDELLSGGAH